MSQTERFFRIEATGKTFDVKDALKAYGFRWNKDRKSWIAEKISESEMKGCLDRALPSGSWSDVKLDVKEIGEETTPF